MKPLLVVSLCLSTALGVSSFSVQAENRQPDPSWRLNKVIIVSRHGVRPPTKMTRQMSEITAQTWPTWSAPLGHLTPTGAKLVTLLGGYYREHLQQAGLFTSACPAEGTLLSWADTDQRTRMTGQAWLDGFAPNCGLKIQSQSDSHKLDPLFHPLEAGVCRADKQQALAAAQKAAGGDVAALSVTYQPALQQLEQVLDFANSPYCKQHGASGCSLMAAYPGKLSASADGSVKLEGNLALGSTLGEIFLLEYADGMPAQSVAWGHAFTPEQWQSLLAVHNTQFRIAQQTPYIARFKASPLMARIQQALKSNDKARLELLVGHDTNLANLAGLLGVQWSLPGQPDNTPPAGELVVERWQDSQQQYWVRMQFVYQTLDQLRAQTPLSLATPPGVVTLALPQCQAQSVNGACPLTRFMTITQQKLQPACLKL